jgi:hypothetical protein
MSLGSFTKIRFSPPSCARYRAHCWREVMFDVAQGPDCGETLLKLTLENHNLVVCDYFTSRDHGELNARPPVRPWLVPSRSAITRLPWPPKTPLRNHAPPSPPATPAITISSTAKTLGSTVWTERNLLRRRFLGSRIQLQAGFRGSESRGHLSPF